MTNAEKMITNTRRPRVYEDKRIIPKVIMDEYVDSIRSRFIYNAKEDMTRGLIDAIIRDGMVSFEEGTERARGEDGRFTDQYFVRAWITILQPRRGQSK